MTITEDAFRLKPIVIPAECTGDVSLTAYIGDLDDPEYLDKSQMSTSISSYINFASITIPASSTTTLKIDYETTTSSIFSNATVAEADLGNLQYIPAFYQSGQVTIEYSFGETDDDDSNVDIKWDLQMEMPDTIWTDLPWYEGNFSTSSQIFKNMITSDKTEVYFPSLAQYTTKTQTFGISSWSQLPPITVKWFTDSPATTVAIRRAMLYPPTFYILVKNNLASSVSLNNATVVFTFNYNPYDILMNMRTEGDRRKKQSRILTLPKGAEATRAIDGFPVYAVLDGYKVAKGGLPEEIIKVFAKWNEVHVDALSNTYYFPTTVQLFPVEYTSGAQLSGPDYPTCLYKTYAYPMTSDDFERVTDGQWMTSDGINVLTAPILAADDHYRCINVRVLNDANPDDGDATFVITTSVNEGIDENISESDLTTYVDKLRFFNVEKDFSTSVAVARSEIDPLYYETLWQTYDKAPVLQSITNEPLYYINFLINDYPAYVPIYNSQTLKFSDTLSHATNGVRSTDIFYMNGTAPNIISVQNPTKNKYKVKFKCDYNVYKDVYVMTKADMGLI